MGFPENLKNLKFQEIFLNKKRKEAKKLKFIYFEAPQFLLNFHDSTIVNLSFKISKKSPMNLAKRLLVKIISRTFALPSFVLSQKNTLSQEINERFLAVLGEKKRNVKIIFDFQEKNLFLKVF